jgi:hypothetical protein
MQRDMGDSLFEVSRVLFEARREDAFLKSSGFQLPEKDNNSHRN